MIEKIKEIVWYAKNMRPLKVRNFFTHVHNFADCDKVIAGYKYAILYGKFMFLSNKYKDGVLDKEYRRQKQDEIIDKFKNPKDRLAYIKLMIDTKHKVIQANEMGLISTPNPQIITMHPDGRVDSDIDVKAKKEEAASYQKAIDNLNFAIIGATIYPRMWQRIFVPQP